MNKPPELVITGAGDLFSRGKIWVQRLALVLCLLTPSLWMLANVPPLWRDVDAYHQLTASPGRSTAGGHGPLYSVAVRVPLYLGYRIEQMTGSAEPAGSNFYLAPRLTDTGIYLLILAQHLALCGAAAGLIISATKRFWARLGLAVLFASNHLFYTFVHCVGSESLSMICILAFAGVGLRLIKNEGAPNWQSWGWFALALLAALLTRYVNLLLALVLPIAFLLATAQRAKRGGWRQALIALFIGIGCICVSRAATEALCRTENLRYYSKLGFTFLWRMDFLEAVPEPERTRLLDRVAARTKTADGRQLISILRAMLQEGQPLQAEPVSQRLRAALFPPPAKVRPRRVHYALNDVARAFLLPPTPEHWSAAQKDFAAIRRLALPEISSFLFITTLYYWAHPGEMPQGAGLSTFRNYTPEALTAIPIRSAYLSLWQPLSLNTCLAAWILATVALLFVGLVAKAGQPSPLPTPLPPLSRASPSHTEEEREGAGFSLREKVGMRANRRIWWRSPLVPLLSTTRNPPLVSICSYCVPLVGVGLVMMEVTALVGELIPRYTLPLWMLLWISIILYAGAAADTFFDRRNQSSTLRKAWKERRKLPPPGCEAGRLGSSPNRQNLGGAIRLARLVLILVIVIITP